jgi:hypothetical protein
LESPDRRIASLVPQPFAVAKVTLERFKCFCLALPSATIASSRIRSFEVTVTSIPRRIPKLELLRDLGESFD